MPDIVVTALHYRLDTIPGVAYEDPSPIEDERDAFRMRLDAGRVTFTMKGEYRTVDAARAAVQGYIDSWEIDAALKQGRREFTLRYERADTEDRTPVPEGSAVVRVAMAAGALAAAGEVTMRVTRKAYPPPPTGFRADINVETLWRRFEDYRNGREKLPSMAYFCLTVLQKVMYPNQASAARSLNIDRCIFREVGRLSTKHGGPHEARKAEVPVHQLVPLSDAQRRWIEAALKAIIRRAGEIGQDSALPRIGMGDLPPLHQQ